MFANLVAFFSGKKTYLVSVATLVYALGIQFGWWPSSSDPIVVMLFGAGGITLRTAIRKLCQQIANDTALNDAALQPGQSLFSPSRAGVKNGGTPLPLIAVFCLLPSVLFLNSGCSTLQVGADTVVVNAERVTALATDTFDTFLRIEYDNRASLNVIAPQIHQFAEKLRQNGQNYLTTARVLTKAYKANRTPENKANLATALSVLTSAAAESQKYLTQINGAGLHH